MCVGGKIDITTYLNIGRAMNSKLEGKITRL